MDVISMIRMSRLVMVAFDANTTEYIDKKMNVTGSHAKAIRLNQNVIAFQSSPENTKYIKYLKRLGELDPDKVIEDFVADVQSLIELNNVDFRGMRRTFEEYGKLRTEKGAESEEAMDKLAEVRENPFFRVFLDLSENNSKAITEETQGLVFIGRTREGLLDIYTLRVLAGIATEGYYVQPNHYDTPYFWYCDMNEHDGDVIKTKMLVFMEYLASVASEYEGLIENEGLELFRNFMRHLMITSFKEYQKEDNDYRGDYHFFEINSQTGGFVQLTDSNGHVIQP